MKSRTVSKIYNPDSKRYVSIKSATGQRLSKIYGTPNEAEKCNADVKQVQEEQCIENTGSPACKRGFKQIKDTCWFTSTLNSLVLGQLSSEHIKNILPPKEDVGLPPLDQCPVKLSKDFILEYAHRFYNPSPQNIQHAENLIQHVVTNNSKRAVGVFPVIVLKTILDECFRDQYVMVRTEQCITTPKNIPEGCKFCVFYNRSDSVMNPTNIPPTLRGTDFVLDSCSIYMKFTTGDPHVICGFKCKNSDYVYDSNMDDPLQIKWSQTATSLSSKIRCYSSEFYKGRSRLSSVGFMYLIYAKTI